MKDIFKRFFKNKNVEPDFVQRFRKDMEDDDVYGPWIRDKNGNIPGEFKWYKSYWFISTSEEADIKSL